MRMCVRCSGAATDLCNSNNCTPRRVSIKLLGASWWRDVNQKVAGCRQQRAATAMLPAGVLPSPASPATHGAASASPSKHVGGTKRKASDSGDSAQTDAPNTLDQHTVKRPRYSPAS